METSRVQGTSDLLTIFDPQDRYRLEWGLRETVNPFSGRRHRSSNANPPEHAECVLILIWTVISTMPCRLLSRIDCKEGDKPTELE